jgi:hypothetical protein
MWPRITVVAVLVLTGCAAQRAEYFAQRDAPKFIQKGVAASLTDSPSPSFGKSYRAGMNPDREIVVCGYVNGKRFAGMFAKPARGAPQFLPIGVAIDQQEEDAVKLYCRDDGIYLPQ